jgi:hypothetical protein
MSLHYRSFTVKGKTSSFDRRDYDSQIGDQVLEILPSPSMTENIREYLSL